MVRTLQLAAPALARPARACRTVWFLSALLVFPSASVVAQAQARRGHGLYLESRLGSAVVARIGHPLYPSVGAARGRQHQRLGLARWLLRAAPER